MNNYPGLVPSPQFYELMDGHFAITEDTVISIQEAKNGYKKWLIDLKNSIYSEIGVQIVIGAIPAKESNNIILMQEEVSADSEEAYELIISKDTIILKGQYKGLYYGLKTLKQLIVKYKNKLPVITIKDKPAFSNRGWMIDITRGKVPKLDYLFEIVDLASDFKVNMLQLYIEHTFMFEFTSEINVGKDGLSGEDIIALDTYCQEHMIQLVPCIATFGHLYEILKSDSYKHLCEYEDYPNEPYDWMKRQLHHTLDCTNPESIELVRNMLRNFVPLFSSPIINICGDETFDIGKGKNKELAEQTGTTKLYINFLKEIMGIVEELGKKVMFFGDMIVKHPEYLEDIPKDVICMNWNYDPEVTEADTYTFMKAGVIQYVCPGAIGWNRALNDYEGAFQNITKLIRYGEKYKASGVLVTDWGDFGSINLLSTSLPGLILGAAMSWNPKASNCDSLQSYHEAICPYLGYEDVNHLNLLTLLTDISNKMHITWEHLMKWYYDVSFGNVSYGDTHDFIEEPDCSFFRTKLEEVDNLLDKLEDYKGMVYSKLNFSRRRDLEEAVHMAKLVKLWQHVGLMIKKFYFEPEEQKTLDDQELRNEAINLAAQLEKWFIRYEKLWRTRNRESELYRIRDVMASLCHYLREPWIYQHK
jgi:hypothetical protein